jgi:streptogramin lyase
LVLAATACGNGSNGGTASGSQGDDGGVTADDDGDTGAGGTAGEGATMSAGDEGTGASADSSGGGDDGPWEPPVNFDVGVVPDTPEQPCSDGPKGNPDEPEFSYLWAANSTQGTISKIDTQTVTEIGRYIVRPDSAGSPSRTSVSSTGNVAVANRSGGITKVYAREEDCQESNGTPGIQTSTDATYLPWGEEECIAWYTPFAYQSQRPVAWIGGELNPQTCQIENERLWTAGMSGGNIDVLLLDGEDGEVIDQVAIPGLVPDSYGLYGGAVDAEGNFWATQLGTANKLVRVDVDDLEFTIYEPPAGPWWYGMTVDSDGYVWMCSQTVARFDPMTETFDTAMVNGYTGCMAAAGDDGLLWMSSSSGGVVGVNRETLAVEATWPTTTSYGMSVDFYGYVWTVNGNYAIRIDPETGDTQSYNGLTGAYTYSDMTGYALFHAGGGAPQG